MEIKVQMGIVMEWNDPKLSNNWFGDELESIQMITSWKVTLNFSRDFIICEKNFENDLDQDRHISLLQEVDEEKVEDPLTGLSGNSSDLSDSEKSSSMQDLKMKWAGDLTRSLSARRQRSGSRWKLNFLLKCWIQTCQIISPEEKLIIV